MKRGGYFPFAGAEGAHQEVGVAESNVQEVALADGRIMDAGCFEC